MKVLYITKGDYPDYMNDTILHGLYSMLGSDLTHTGPSHYMYKQFNDDDSVSKLYGKGFTIFSTLPEYLNDNSDIIQKINNKYFDYIFYGSIYRDQSYLDLVESIYGKNKICLIDGEDITNILPLSSRFIYFKRELTEIRKNVYPISFSIPSEKIIKNPEFIIKIRKESNVKPKYDGQSYIYTKEDEYYKDYQESYFGLTTKKGGWDCLRHYEILGNYCIPYFPDINSCPQYTMVNFPKDVIKKSNKFFENDIMNDEYYDVLNYLFEYTKENLTTIQAVKNILNLLKNK